MPTGDGITLDHVVIAVSDWERSNRFYAEVCGAQLVRLDEPSPTRWRYRFGDIMFNVHGPGMDPRPVARIPAAPGRVNADGTRVSSKESRNPRHPLLGTAWDGPERLGRPGTPGTPSCK